MAKQAELRSKPSTRKPTRNARKRKSTVVESEELLTDKAPAKKTAVAASDKPEPSKEQLEKARTEAEKALKELERQGAGDSTLSRYFREMACHRVLTPQEEIDAAQNEKS